MKDAEKMLAFVLFAIFAVSFINRGSAVIGSSPQGANFSVGYAGISR